MQTHKSGNRAVSNNHSGGEDTIPHNHNTFIVHFFRVKFNFNKTNTQEGFRNIVLEFHPTICREGKCSDIFLSLSLSFFTLHHNYLLAYGSSNYVCGEKHKKLADSL